MFREMGYRENFARDSVLPTIIFKTSTAVHILIQETCAVARFSVALMRSQGGAGVEPKRKRICFSNL